MSRQVERSLQDAHEDDSLEQATAWFLRMRRENAQVEDLLQFQSWLEQDPSHSSAYRKVSASWSEVGAHASAPEFVVARRDALEDARRASLQRWSSSWTGRRKLALAAALAGIAFTIGLALWIALAYPAAVYETALGERRTLTLEDGSVVTLDARSRIKVKYSDEARLVALEQGQARFEVAKDSTRPFRVHAGSQTVQALGTQFNVELVADTVLVTLIEGHVAVTEERTGVLPAVLTPNSKPAPIEMRAGQQLVAQKTKPAKIRSNVDVTRTTSWQTGKLFFDNEPLCSAAARMNRYARQEIEVDASVSQVGISGVFNAGDTAAFTEAVTTYFPVKVERLNETSIQLTAR